MFRPTPYPLRDWLLMIGSTGVLVSTGFMYAFSLWRQAEVAIVHSAVPSVDTVPISAEVLAELRAAIEERTARYEGMGTQNVSR